MPPRADLLRRAVAEALGTALLLATVVGSGIMAERLAGGNVAIALLANTIATGAALVALILTFGAISGAHFNPAVTLADASQGGRSATRSARAWPSSCRARGGPRRARRREAGDEPRAGRRKRTAGDRRRAAFYARSAGRSGSGRRRRAARSESSSWIRHLAHLISRPLPSPTKDILRVCELTCGA
ncbi:aquaporin [Sorangium sp. So ce185]